MLLNITLRVLQPVEDRQVTLSLLKTFYGSTPFDGLVDVGQSILQTTNVSAKALASTTDIVNSILNFSFDQYSKNHRIGALWRDSIELDMQVLRDSVCRSPDRWTESQYQLLNTPGRDDACREIMRVYRQGYSDLREWYNLQRSPTMEPFTRRLVPDARHFIQVSALLFQACEDLGLGGDKLKSKLDECRQYYGKNSDKNRLLFGNDLEKVAKVNDLSGAESRARCLVETVSVTSSSKQPKLPKCSVLNSLEGTPVQ